MKTKRPLSTQNIHDKRTSYFCVFVSVQRCFLESRKFHLDMIPHIDIAKKYFGASKGLLVSVTCFTFFKIVHDKLTGWGTLQPLHIRCFTIGRTFLVPARARQYDKIFLLLTSQWRALRSNVHSFHWLKMFWLSIYTCTFLFMRWEPKSFFGNLLQCCWLCELRLFSSMCWWHFTWHDAYPNDMPYRFLFQPFCFNAGFIL